MRTGDWSYNLFLTNTLLGRRFNTSFGSQRISLNLVWSLFCLFQTKVNQLVWNNKTHYLPWRRCLVIWNVRIVFHTVLRVHLDFYTGLLCHYQWEMDYYWRKKVAGHVVVEHPEMKTHLALWEYIYNGVLYDSETLGNWAFVSTRVRALPPDSKN